MHRVVLSLLQLQLLLLANQHVPLHGGNAGHDSVNTRLAHPAFMAMAVPVLAGGDDGNNREQDEYPRREGKAPKVDDDGEVGGEEVDKEDEEDDGKEFGQPQLDMTEGLFHDEDTAAGYVPDMEAVIMDRVLQRSRYDQGPNAAGPSNAAEFMAYEHPSAPVATNAQHQIRDPVTEALQLMQETLPVELKEYIMKLHDRVRILDVAKRRLSTFQEEYDEVAILQNIHLLRKQRQLKRRVEKAEKELSATLDKFYDRRSFVQRHLFTEDEAPRVFGEKQQRGHIPEPPLRFPIQEQQLQEQPQPNPQNDHLYDVEDEQLDDMNAEVDNFNDGLGNYNGNDDDDDFEGGDEIDVGEAGEELEDDEPMTPPSQIIRNRF